MNTPAENLRRAQAARQKFLAVVDAAARDLAVELQMNCGVSEAHIDFKALDGAISDGTADMLADAFYHLREEAAAEGDAQAFAESRADLADFHKRVA